MAYAPTYVAADVSAISIDGIATIGAALASLATLIGLALLYGWFKKHL
jgi:hypothetical protein